ncbi:MAG TPA: hypothetical protein VLB46_13575 [Pyrinomonadaceae bacterium]|nr:hypothetical protein [Pyrinomonadaceae bacterium]
MSSVDYSHWMQDLAPVIGDVPLNQLPIPGSHDSGTWDLDRLAITQSLTIEEQLARGIRYFDFRPKERDRRFYIHHTEGTDNHLATYPEQGFPSGMDVDALIDADNRPIIFAQMRKFLIANPYEVLILRFQTFESFSADDGDGTNDFTRLAMLANAYFYVNPATHNGVGCQLLPYTPSTQTSKSAEKTELRNTFSQMTLNNLNRNHTRVIIFFADDEVQKTLGAATFDYHNSGVWPRTTALGNTLLYEPYWKEAGSFTADDDSESVEKTWFPYHVKNIHKWDVVGFYVLQSHMEELSSTAVATSAGYHSSYISEQCAEYTYNMEKDSQGNLISNNGRNADRYIEWMKAGMTVNMITFDFIQYGDLMSKIMQLYQDAKYRDRQLYFAPRGGEPWKIYPRTMCAVDIVNRNAWYVLISDPTNFPFGGDGRVRPDYLNPPHSYELFTFIDNLDPSRSWTTTQGVELIPLMGVCGNLSDGPMQEGPASRYYDRNINTYVKP